MSSYAERAIAAFERLETENAKLQERIHKLEMEGSDHFYRMAYAEDANRTLEAENTKLQDENAKLREQLDVAEHNQTRNAREYARLCHENDKLRELVRVMAYCMQHERECDGCRLNGADGNITAPVGCDGLLDRMRELGIEV